MSVFSHDASPTQRPCAITGSTATQRGIAAAVRDVMKDKLLKFQADNPGASSRLTDLNPLYLHLHRVIHEKETEYTKHVTGRGDAHIRNPYYDDHDRYDPRVTSLITRIIHNDNLQYPLRELHQAELYHDRLQSDNIEDMRVGNPPRHGDLNSSLAEIAKIRNNLRYAAGDQVSSTEQYLPTVYDDKGKEFPGHFYALADFSPKAAALSTKNARARAEASEVEEASRRSEAALRAAALRRMVASKIADPNEQNAGIAALRLRQYADSRLGPGTADALMPYAGGLLGAASARYGGARSGRGRDGTLDAVEAGRAAAGLGAASLASGLSSAFGSGLGLGPRTPSQVEPMDFRAIFYSCCRGVQSRSQETGF